MSIGSVYGFDYKLTSAMSEIIEAWENTLEANHDDFTVVDNEEGDHGIIRYLDAKGVEMLTKVVQGGDQEETYFTGEGADAVRQMLNKNFNEILELALIAGMPTPDDLKAHIPPEVRIIDLKKHVLPDVFGRFDLVLFDDNYFMPFQDQDNSNRFLLWCNEENEYMRIGDGLYQTLDTWREGLVTGKVTVGVHNRGLYDLIQCFVRAGKVE